MHTNKNKEIIFYYFIFIYFTYRWCVFFSHPSDFTPVCTTELGRIAVHQPYFTKRNVKLIAHSVDDLQNHVDWVNVSNKNIRIN